MSRGTLLIVDDIPVNLNVLADTLAETGHDVSVATDGESALEQVAYAPPDLILLDVVMPGIDGFETCRRLKEDPETKDIPVIFMTALSETVDKVKGFEVGAVDYVTKPFQQAEVLARVDTHLTLRQLQSNLEDQVRERTTELRAALAQVEQLKNRLQAENVYLQEEIKLQHNFEAIISRSQPMVRMLERVEQVAPTDATVLLQGETGTGKELVARAVHHTSLRSNRPLVKVNCAALPASLIESELFGHEKGAFTGAVDRKTGRFELADGGTIFLDEIGDLPLELQVKLLRVLQEGEIERLGNAHPIAVDVRVLAATNRDLEQAARQGEFREDLYYRLNVFPIHLPPLRGRKEDIPLMVTHFVRKYEAKIGKQIDPVPQSVIDALMAYDWPGNVRELEHTIHRAVIVCKGRAIRPEDLELSPVKANTGPGVSPQEGGNLSERLADFERQCIEAALDRCGGKVKGDHGAAERLGVPESTLRRRMIKLGVQQN